MYSFIAILRKYWPAILLYSDDMIYVIPTGQNAGKIQVTGTKYIKKTYSETGTKYAAISGFLLDLIYFCEHLN